MKMNDAQMEIARVLQNKIFCILARNLISRFVSKNHMTMIEAAMILIWIKVTGNR